MLEKTIKLLVKKRLAAIGAYFFSPVQMGIGTRTLDYLVCYKGRFIGIECKAPGKTLELHQKITSQKIVDAGGLAFMVDSEQAANDLFNCLEGHWENPSSLHARD